MKSRGLSLLILFLCLPLFAQAGNWLDQEEIIAKENLLASINRPETVSGTVVASPQRENPNYFFHWVRDAALTMDIVVTLFKGAKSLRDKNRYESLIKDYVELSLHEQTSNARSGLGEPKFEVNGEPYMGDWGRPQNDGPALRAITLIHYAQELISRGESIHHLYRAELPANSIIKRDLEFISHHWRESTFDIWEEVLGDHFYTRMVQRKALIEGAKLARMQYDSGAAEWYEKQAQELTSEIEKYYDLSLGYIVATLNRQGGLDYKTSNLDSSIILGVLHGYTGDGFFSYKDWRVKKTVENLLSTFKSIYPINQRTEISGLALGRYPEDRYAGANFNGGNPWVLVTLGFAEFYYKQGLLSEGDLLIERVRTHANPDGSLSEQMDRYTGFMISAADLTWNYAALLTAAYARRELFPKLN